MAQNIHFDQIPRLHPNLADCAIAAWHMNKLLRIFERAGREGNLIVDFYLC